MLIGLFSPNILSGHFGPKIGSLTFIPHYITFTDPKINYIKLWEYFVHFEGHISVHVKLFQKYDIAFFGLCKFLSNGYLFSNDAVFLGHPVQ